jgi:thiamine biosynthesis lipoprotein ApbE
VLVQLDGIIRVGGTSPTDDGWLTVVPHPRGHFATAVLRLHDAAVVTMANPRAGSPTEGAVAGVSVVSDRAWEAELLATTALSAGRSGGAESAVEFLSATGLPALVLDEWDDAVPLGTWTTLSATGAAQPSLVSSR